MRFLHMAVGPKGWASLRSHHFGKDTSQDVRPSAPWPLNYCLFFFCFFKEKLPSLCPKFLNFWNCIQSSWLIKEYRYFKINVRVKYSFFVTTVVKYNLQILPIISVSVEWGCSNQASITSPDGTRVPRNVFGTATVLRYLHDNKVGRRGPNYRSSSSDAVLYIYIRCSSEKELATCIFKHVHCQLSLLWFRS